MENYKLYKEFLSSEFCNKVISEFKNYFRYRPQGVWVSWEINNLEYKDYILNKFKELIPSGSFNTRINITVYNEGDKLRMHRDTASDLTIVANLNCNYDGGDFRIYDKNIKLGTGDVVTFNGATEQHGVREVSKGTRYSLNIWQSFDRRKHPELKSSI